MMITCSGWMCHLPAFLLFVKAVPNFTRLQFLCEFHYTFINYVSIICQNVLFQLDFFSVLFFILIFSNNNALRTAILFYQHLYYIHTKVETSSFYYPLAYQHTCQHGVTFTLSYMLRLFLSPLPSSSVSLSVAWGFSSSFKYSSSSRENATPLSTHTTGVSVSMRRTITPAKYTALSAYSTTRTNTMWSQQVKLMRAKYVLTALCCGMWPKENSPNTRSSVMLLMQYHRPTGNVVTRMWRSKKKENQVVGWCSDTDAMMGMCTLA